MKPLFRIIKIVRKPPYDRRDKPLHEVSGLNRWRHLMLKNRIVYFRSVIPLLLGAVACFLSTDPLDEVFFAVTFDVAAVFLSVFFLVADD